MVWVEGDLVVGLVVHHLLVGMGEEDQEGHQEGRLVGHHLHRVGDQRRTWVTIRMRRCSGYRTGGADSSSKDTLC